MEKGDVGEYSQQIAGVACTVMVRDREIHGTERNVNTTTELCIVYDIRESIRGQQVFLTGFSQTKASTYGDRGDMSTHRTPLRVLLPLLERQTVCS